MALRHFVSCLLSNIFQKIVRCNLKKIPWACPPAIVFVNLWKIEMTGSAPLLYRGATDARVEGQGESEINKFSKFILVVPP